MPLGLRLGGQHSLATKPAQAAASPEPIWCDVRLPIALLLMVRHYFQTNVYRLYD